MRYVIARINDNLFESEIAEGIDILQGITLVADTCKEVSVNNQELLCKMYYSITELKFLEKFSKLTNRFVRTNGEVGTVLKV